MDCVAIPLTDTLREHMRSRVAGDDFQDEGDYLRWLVALDYQKAENLREAVKEGLESGISERSIDQILEVAKRRHFSSGA